MNQIQKQNQQQYPYTEAAKMLREGVIQNFAWCFEDKEEAEKARKAINMALLRQELNTEFTVSVVSAVKNNLTQIIHFVYVEKTI